VSKNGDLSIVAADAATRPKAGETVIALVEMQEPLEERQATEQDA
jgi:hypothetical protein